MEAEGNLHLHQSSNMADEDLVRCPYNSSHYVPTKRMTIHVEKCRKQYLELMKRTKGLVEMVCCKHNRTHHVPLIELTYHEMRCDDQFGSYDPYHQYFALDAVVKYLHQGETPTSELKSHYIPPPYLNVHTTLKEFEGKCMPLTESERQDYEDDWTLVPGGVAYDPQKKLDEELVLYIPRGLTKSEKEKYVQKNIEKAKTVKRFKGLPNKMSKKKDGDDDDEDDEEDEDEMREISEFNCDTISEVEALQCTQYDDTEAETEND